MYLDKITKGELAHIQNYHSGWAVIRGEAEVPAGIQILEITNDVRIINTYRTLKCVSLGVFINTISKAHVRNMGIKSIKVLAEGLHRVISGNKIGETGHSGQRRSGRHLLNFGKITKEEEIHLQNYHLGWAVLRGEAQVPDGIKILDITTDVRILNVYQASGREPLSVFLDKISNSPPQKIGNFSFRKLAEGLHKEIVRGEMNQLKSKILSRDYYSMGYLALNVLFRDINVLISEGLLDDSVVSAWIKSFENSTFLDEIVTPVWFEADGQTYKMTLGEALDKFAQAGSLRAGNIDASTTWVVRAIAHSANRESLNQIDELINSSQSFNTRTSSIIHREDNLGKLNVRQDDWDLWWGIVFLRRATKFTMGRIATESGLDWQTNEFGETILKYYEKSPSQLLARRSIGWKKFKRIAKLLAYLVAKGCPEQISPIEPWNAIKALNLDVRDYEVIKIRYGGGKVPTLDACGKQFGVTRERIRQIEEKVASAAHHSGLSTRAMLWLDSNTVNIWEQLSRDGGVTVDLIDESPVALRRKLNSEERLGLLLSGYDIIQFLEKTGTKTDSGWRSKVKGVEEIRIKLSGRHKSFNV